MTDDSKATPRPWRQQFYQAFYDWFLQGGCDFWSESNAPDEKEADERLARIREALGSDDLVEGKK